LAKIAPTNDVISPADVLKSYCSLLAQAKSYFVAIEQYRGDGFFRESLGTSTFLSKEPCASAWMTDLSLKTVRAYLLKKDSQRFWNYKSAGWADKFLDDWCRRTMRSRIEPMKKVARMLRSHRGLILNWFRAKKLIALGAVEGLNNKAKVTTKRAYGFKSIEVKK